MTFNVSKGAAEDNLEHPFIEQSEIKSATCLTCHPGKKEGKFVHSAVVMGCQNCHRATSGIKTTTINFVAVDGALCARCHEAKKAKTLHKPYKDGQCLICHNPHASGFKAQARASVDNLCMSCHGTGRPDVHVDANTQMVSLLDGRTYDLASFQKAPKVGGEHAEITMPPLPGGTTPTQALQKADAAQSCVSCHDPHASEERPLLHKAAERGCSSDIFHLSDFLHAWHVNSNQRNIENLRDPFQGGRS